jgi:preprotein translocase subunit SecF
LFRHTASRRCGRSWCACRRSAPSRRIAERIGTERRKCAPQGESRKLQSVGTEIVGPSVGKELTQKGIWAFVLSLVGILAYIAFRFEFSFARGAVIATLHDVLVTFAFLAFFRYD